MSILAVDAALADLHGVDEEESEAVALGLLEFLFAETNALYRQHCATREAVAATATLLTDSVFDVIACATLQPESTLEEERFTAEPSPRPEIRDRHAVRSLPLRSPDKYDALAAGKLASAGACQTQRSRVESHGGADRTRLGTSRRRRKPDKVNKTPLVTIPQVIPMTVAPEEEEPHTKAWRLQCLKDMAGDAKKPSLAASKWATVSRPSSVVEPRVSLEVEVIDSAPLLLRQELGASTAATAVKMKSSLNTFSAISVPTAPTGDASDQAGSDPVTPSRTSSATIPARKASTVQLNDSLSRKRSTVSSQTQHSSPGSGSLASARSNPWHFDSDGDTGERFAADVMTSSAASIPTVISMSAGVELTQAETTIKGPERVDSVNAMSRKRFELHQRLATDFLLQESVYAAAMATAPGSPAPSSSHYSHHALSPRPYEQVPPDPIPLSTLSPIAKDALIIPRTHLSQSASTPSLRVRHPGKLLQRDDPRTMTMGRLTSVLDMGALRKPRPNTALGAVTAPRSGRTGSVAPTSRAAAPNAASLTAAGKYLREFPKPQPGVIKLNKRENSSGAIVDSARQRMAWIS